MEELKGLLSGQIVEIFSKPLTEENREGTAKIIKIDGIYQSGEKFMVGLIVCFGIDDKEVYRIKYYKK